MAMTEEELAEIEAQANDWSHDPDPDYHYPDFEEYVIATAVPSLIAEVRRLRSNEESLEASNYHLEQVHTPIMAAAEEFKSRAKAAETEVQRLQEVISLGGMNVLRLEKLQEQSMKDWRLLRDEHEYWRKRAEAAESLAVKLREEVDRCHIRWIEADVEALERRAEAAEAALTALQKKYADLQQLWRDNT